MMLTVKDYLFIGGALTIYGALKVVDIVDGVLVQPIVEFMNPGEPRHYWCMGCLKRDDDHGFESCVPDEIGMGWQRYTPSERFMFRHTRR